MEKIEFEILTKRIRPKLLSVTRNFTLASGLETDDVVQEALMNLQTQYDLDSVRIAEGNNLRETVSVTIPVNDRNLLKEIARKFGSVK